MKSILLVGSSIFEAWTQVTNLLPDCRITNRAVGGTITAYWIQHLAGILAAESPDMVLYYCGSNDLNCEVSEQEIVANVRESRVIVSGQLPAAKFAYFGIIKAPQKAGKWDIIDNLNKTISSGLHANDLYVDPNSLFFCDGAPIERFFVEDGLHLTVEAYNQLSKYAAPLIDKWRNE